MIKIYRRQDIAIRQYVHLMSVEYQKLYAKGIPPISDSDEDPPLTRYFHNSDSPITYIQKIRKENRRYRIVIICLTILLIVNFFTASSSLTFLQRFIRILKNTSKQ